MEGSRVHFMHSVPLHSADTVGRCRQPKSEPDILLKPPKKTKKHDEETRECRTGRLMKQKKKKKKNKNKMNKNKMKIEPFCDIGHGQSCDRPSALANDHKLRFQP